MTDRTDSVTKEIPDWVRESIDASELSWRAKVGDEDVRKNVVRNMINVELGRRGLTCDRLYTQGPYNETFVKEFFGRDPRDIADFAVRSVAAYLEIDVSELYR